MNKFHRYLLIIILATPLLAGGSDKKLMREKRDELDSSLEDEIFRTPGTEEAARKKAVEGALARGKHRMAATDAEETDIRIKEAELGIEDARHQFLGDEYLRVLEEYRNVNIQIGELQAEEKRLRFYLKKLRGLEKKRPAQ